MTGRPPFPGLPPAARSCPPHPGLHDPSLPLRNFRRAMNERTFPFRLRSSHAAPDRATQDLVVEFLGDSGEWEPQQLSLTMPGFRIYLISLLLCQHVYLVANARDGSCQERCHPLEAFYASFAKVTWRLVCWVANGSLIHTKSGCFQQRIDLLQRFGFTRRACS